MEGLKNLIIKCQQKGKELWSHLLATDNPETLIETIMKEPEEKIVSDELPEIRSEQLYTEPEQEEEVSINDSSEAEEDIKTEQVDVELVDKLIQECEDNPLQKVEVTSEKKADTDEPKVLDNINTDKNNDIINSIVQLIEELDNVSANIEDENAKNVIVYCQNRMMETLLKNGCERIEEEKEFDCLRHTTCPLIMTPNGTTIQETTRLGMIFNGKVVLKAVVRI